ncbi:hypothetical protein Taro_034140 [Colocasia esculenta]|uniref:Uncharacterized protein n=1 Tax=Colocasia esculenta TaxID=4460 RepID=A0A843W932_COLES|nr:hypothetical protein [Colocasia esculenta]
MRRSPSKNTHSLSQPAFLSSVPSSSWWWWSGRKERACHGGSGNAPSLSSTTRQRIAQFSPPPPSPSRRPQDPTPPRSPHAPSHMPSRPPNYEFQEWWNRERERSALLDLHDPAGGSVGADGRPAVEIVNRAALLSSPTSTSTSSPSAAAGDGKGRGRSARQLSWLCLLRAHHSAAALVGVPSRLASFLLAAFRRVSSSPSDRPSRLYGVIRGFLVLAVVLLTLEVAAYFKGWHFTPPTHAEAVEALELLYAHWLRVRANYLAPPVQAVANLCIVMFLLQSVDRLVLVLGCFWIKFRGLRPVAAVEYGGKGDAEKGGVDKYPMVLLQIPMCNEREVRVGSLYALLSLPISALPTVSSTNGHSLAVFMNVMKDRSEGVEKI